MSEPNLPAVPEPAELVEGVVDAELVDEPPAGRTAVVVQVVQAVTVVVQHPHTRRAARHAAYIAAGMVVAARRRRRGRTLAGQMAELAAARGDLDKAKDWAELDHKHRMERARERRDRRDKTVRMLVALPSAVAGTAIFLGALSVLLIVTGNGASAAEPWRLLGAAVRALVTAWRIGWELLPYLLPAAFLVWLGRLHYLGRTAGALAPSWSIAAKGAAEDRGLVVTADSIVLALKHLPIPDLKKAFKDGWTPSFHTLPIKDGEGYFSVFSLPMGVTATMIADKNEIFARNLHRAKTENWPTDAEREKIAPAGYVALWVANPGVLDKPAPEYPLLHDGTADVFEGVPGGVTARGDQVLLPVVANNLVLGGQMGQGKSNGCRVFMLGCALDPLCELDVFVFAGNGDFDSFAPRLAVYRKGADDSTVVAAAERLNELLEEVGRREIRLAELGAKKLTRHIAERHPDMRPLVVLFSECHELFSHSEYGELAAELAVKIIKRARKTGIVLAFDTQSSRAGAIPSELVELVSVNGAFYVKTWRSNDGFLGDGSFQSGIRATELRPGRDRGRSLITGVSDAQFELLKWHYIFSNDDTGEDDATPVIERAMRNLAPGTRVMGGDGASLPVITVRDLLGDLDGAVSGPERVKLRDAVGLLRKVDQMYPRYRQLTAAQLRADLAAEGVRTVNTSGTLYLDPEALHRAVKERGE